MILVVDDYDDSRKALVRLLEADGYQTAEANGGQAALTFMATSTPKLVLIDYRMPDLNGLEVFDLMKSDPRLSQIPVIMFTADVGDIEQTALAAGIAAYIKKGSLDWTRLRAAISRYVTPAHPSRLPAKPRPQIDKNVG